MQAHMAVVNRILGGGFNDKIHLSVVTQFISRLLIICIFNNLLNNYNILAVRTNFKTKRANERYQEYGQP